MYDIFIKIIFEEMENFLTIVIFLNVIPISLEIRLKIKRKWENRIIQFFNDFTEFEMVADLKILQKLAFPRNQERRIGALRRLDFSWELNFIELNFSWNYPDIS